MDKISYALGLSMGNNFRRSGITSLNYEDFTDGVKAAFTGEGAKMTVEEAKEVINRFFTEMEEQTKEVNRKAGEAYLAENAKREEVKVNDDVPTYTKSSKSKSRRKGRRGRGSRRVTIKNGDTLSEIAHRNHTTVAKLKRLNKISGTNIRAGKKIRVK